MSHSCFFSPQFVFKLVSSVHQMCAKRKCLKRVLEMWWKTWETVMLRGKNTCGKGQLGYANVKSCAKLLWLALKILQKDFMCANHRFKRRWAGKKSERPVHVRHFKWIWQQLGAKRAANCLAVSQQCQKGKCGSKREKKHHLIFSSSLPPLLK